MQVFTNFLTSFHIFDIVFLLIAVVFYLKGYHRGLVGTLLTYVFFFAKFILSYVLSATVGLLISKTKFIESSFEKIPYEVSLYLYQIIAFLIILIILSLIFRSIVKDASKMFKTKFLSQTNQLLGGLLSVGLYLAVSMLFYYLLLSSVLVYFPEIVPKSNILIFIEWIIYR